MGKLFSIKPPHAWSLVLSLFLLIVSIILENFFRTEVLQIVSRMLLTAAAFLFWLWIVQTINAVDKMKMKSSK